MSHAELIEQYEERAEAERQHGAHVEINPSYQYVAITLSAPDSEWFFQGEDADNLLDDFEQSCLADFLDPETYLLAVAQNW